jgi:predicted N-acetyltransferase YhbS
MSRIIRPAIIADIPVIARLRWLAFFDGTDRTEDDDAADLLALLGGDGFEVALVAELDGAVVGTCLMVRHELPPAHDLSPWLAGLVVAAEQRKRGIGVDLVAAIEAHAIDRGVDRIHLYTGTAEPFYARLGWRVAERSIDDEEETVLMVRDLA